MLNDRSKEILIFIDRFKTEHGYPPTIREIGRAFGIASTNGVRFHLTRLEKAGKLQRTKKFSRGLTTMEPPRERGIPVLGRIAAGPLSEAIQNYDRRLDLDGMFGDPAGLFALSVKGDSMVDAGILEGDYVIVQQRDHAAPGEIVVAMVGEEATVKTFRPREDRIELVPANQNYAPIQVERDEEFRILGIVKGVIRTVGR